MGNRYIAIDILVKEFLVSSLFVRKRDEMDTEKTTMYEVSPFPPMACRSLRWSTVICRISAFSSLDDPWRELKHFSPLHRFHLKPSCCMSSATDTMVLINNYNLKKNKSFATRGVTCFSKALGTSLLSSDRLWLIRSLRLFSMIYATRTSRGTVSANPPPKKIQRHKFTIQGYNPLTPLLFFRARIWDALPGDMDPVTGLHHGDKDREGERERQRKMRETWGMALAQRQAWWLWFCCILLLLPSLI